MSKLAAGLAALIAAGVAAFVGGLNIPENLQLAAAGIIGIIGTALFPSFKAQFDEAKAQLVSVITLLIVLVVDWLVVTKLGIPEGTQQAVLAIVTALGSLFAPALTLQQATRFRTPGSTGDTRPPA